MVAPAIPACEGKEQKRFFSANCVLFNYLLGGGEGEDGAGGRDGVWGFSFFYFYYSDGGFICLGRFFFFFFLIARLVF